jgi:CheY-like chemotaxis protein
MANIKNDQKNFILLVEDSQDDVDLILRSFKKNNITNDIIIAKDGVIATDFLFGTGEYKGRDLNILPTVVLLDIKMPRMDGMEVLARIRANERTKLLPVVFLTSSNEEQDLLKGYHLGANSYVRKPVDFQEFNDSVRQLGLYWLLLNEPPPFQKGK